MGIRPINKRKRSNFDRVQGDLIEMGPKKWPKKATFTYFQTNRQYI